MSAKESVLAKAVWQETKPASPAVRNSRKRSVSDFLVYAAGAVLLFIVACALVPGWIAPYTPTEMLTDRIMQPPGGSHLFGTDYFGRDIFSVVVYGSRDSLLIGIASVAAGLLAGGAIGALAGYAGGIIDMVLMRLLEILMTIPGILLALAIAAALGPSLANIVIAVSLSAVPAMPGCSGDKL